MLVVCLFLVIVISSCTPQDSGNNQTWVGDGDDSGSESPETGDGDSQPPATDGGTGNDLPPTGQPAGNPQQDLTELKEYIQQIVDDPDSTIKANLEALALAKQSGMDAYDDFYQMILVKIRAKMSKTLSRTDLCQNDLLPLIELGKSLGMEDEMIDEAAASLGRFTSVKDLITGAEKMYPTVPRDCSLVEYKYDSVNEDGDYWVKVTASLLGDLKEQTILDRVNFEARAYSWQRGRIEWNYAAESKDSCMKTTKSSIGRADLTKNDGYVEVYSDRKFYGVIINKAIQIEVRETLQPTDPKEDCSEYKPQSYTEEGSIQAYIKGSWTDKYKIVAPINDKTEPSETNGHESTFVLANLHIPFPE